MGVAELEGEAVEAPPAPLPALAEALAVPPFTPPAPGALPLSVGDTLALRDTAGEAVREREGVMVAEMLEEVEGVGVGD